MSASDFREIKDKQYAVVIKELIRIATKQHGRTLQDKELDTLNTMSLIISEFQSKLLWKMYRIHKVAPKFKAKQILLSNKAGQELRAIQKEKWLVEDTLLGLPYIITNKIPDDIFCRYE